VRYKACHNKRKDSKTTCENGENGAHVERIFRGHLRQVLDELGTSGYHEQGQNVIAVDRNRAQFSFQIIAYNHTALNVLKENEERS
jgi:hypothetical protein